MRRLWDIFGALLEGMSPDCVPQNLTGEMPAFGQPPDREYDPNILFRKDVNSDTLYWVTSVAALTERDPIPLSNVGSGNVLMRPGKYVIPTYQRRYAWTWNNVNQLYRDLLRAAEQHKSSYHLGTLIFHAPKIGNDENTFFVVDEQQRLRTISRLLSREIFCEKEEFRPERQFSDENEKTIWLVLQRFCEDDRREILDMLLKSTFVCIAVNEIAESFQLFSTQNGRSKTLSPEKLLKAYHFHEIQDAENLSSDTPDCRLTESNPLDRTDEEWERCNQKRIPGGGAPLLRQVLGEHLYRIRRMLLGHFPKAPFSAKNVNGFKELTVNTVSDRPNSLPLGNLSVLRRHGDQSDRQLAHRSGSDRMDPFVFIDHPIVNGSDFFTYAHTYCDAYEALFGGEAHQVPGLEEFYAAYKSFCLYRGSGRRKDWYARHIFQSLCLYCYDRFGVESLNRSFRYLYCYAYYERAVNSRCYCHTCGASYVPAAIQIMADTSDLPDLTDHLCGLYLDACENFEKSTPASLNGLELVQPAFFREN